MLINEIVYLKNWWAMSWLLYLPFFSLSVSLSLSLSQTKGQKYGEICHRQMTCLIRKTKSFNVTWAELCKWFPSGCNGRPRGPRRHGPPPDPGVDAADSARTAGLRTSKHSSSRPQKSSSIQVTVLSSFRHTVYVYCY